MSFANTVALVEIITLAQKLSVKAFASLCETGLSKIAWTWAVSLAIDIDQRLRKNKAIALNNKIWDCVLYSFHFSEFSINTKKDGLFFCLIKDSKLIFELIRLKGRIPMNFIVVF